MQCLDGNWHFDHTGHANLASVPGCIHADLLRHHLIPDPFYARNELDLQWIAEKDWTYRLEFTPESALFDHEFIDLVFEGLDTVANVRLDGLDVLQSDNMFHRHRVNLTQRLRLGHAHRLDVRFASALDYTSTARDFVSPWRKDDPAAGPVRIRKQQCQFGWDWGPRLVTAGIWRPVRLEAWSTNRLESVHIRQEHREDAVTLHLTASTALPSESGELRGGVFHEGECVATITDGRATIPQPLLWWPVGHGGQPLYEVRCDWVVEGRTVSSWNRRIGLRTITLDTDNDDSGWLRVDGTPMHRFGFRVNGKLIFAKGANWIPAHSFPHIMEAADYEPLLQAAVEANMNMLRVWGGGVYEHDAFYDLCDKLGLLVWQDLMFACELYPSDAAFLESCRVEFQQQSERLRHHACLALWCGNNELPMLNHETLKIDAAFREGYKRLFLETAPEALAATDGGTPYIHSSPAYDITDGDTVLHRVPGHDAHDWDVWHSRKPVEHYLGTRHRFASEFGMQSYPSQETALTFCPPNQLNVFSAVFENHQKNRAGNQIIFDYVSRLYRFPKDYRSLAYLSQLNQAHCMKTAIEHFRRQSPHNLGALYWQLNDCWPVSSWSSLEFLPGDPAVVGQRSLPKWKALHYAARRFFAPTLLSLVHTGNLEPVGNNETRNTLGPVEFWTVHEGDEIRDARIDWRLFLIDSPEPVAKGSMSVLLREGGGMQVDTVDFAQLVEQHGRERVVLHAVLKDAAGAVLSENSLLFTPPRFVDLPSDPIVIDWERLSPCVWQLTLRSAGFHAAVCLELEGMRPKWSNNFFDLLPGEPTNVILGLPEENETNALTGYLGVRSLVDSYERT